MLCIFGYRKDEEVRIKKDGNVCDGYCDIAAAVCYNCRKSDGIWDLNGTALDNERMIGRAICQISGHYIKEPRFSCAAYARCSKIK